MYVRTGEGLGQVPISDSDFGGAFGAHDGLGKQALNEVDWALSAAKRQMQMHYDGYVKYASAAGKGDSGIRAAKERAKYWEWSAERDFLERLKAVYEPQAGVPLNYTSYPVTKVDPTRGRSGRDNPWRPSARRQRLSQAEADGSFCLGASRAMAFRTIFGLDRPTYRSVLMDLKGRIETAKASGNTAAEAALIISRIVSHSHDPGSLKQFNQDLASRYGIKNTIVRSASRSDALNALKLGSPVIADLEGGWHWVTVHRSPRGQLWANDPLAGRGTRKITLGEIGSRFELIVDATTGKPVTLAEARAHNEWWVRRRPDRGVMQLFGPWTATEGPWQPMKIKDRTPYRQQRLADQQSVSQAH
jgi:hypothetical protein